MKLPSGPLGGESSPFVVAATRFYCLPLLCILTNYTETMSLDSHHGMKICIECYLDTTHSTTWWSLTDPASESVHARRSGLDYGYVMFLPLAGHFERHFSW